MAEDSVTIPIKEVKISDEERPPDEIMAIDPPEPAEPEPVEPEPAEPPQPKKRGRPVGSKSKEPGKPRAKRVPKKPLESIEATDTVRIENDDLPRVLYRSQPIPQYSHDDSSELLLRLLSHQATQRKRNKVELWKSWFK